MQAPRRAIWISWGLLLVVCGAEAGANRLPSLPAMARENAPMLVRVLPLDARSLPRVGFVVGTHGVVVAPRQGARVGDGVVVERSNGERRRARVVAVDVAADLAAVATLPSGDDELWATMLLASTPEVPRPHDWLIGVFLKPDGEPVASLGGVREAGKKRWLLDLPCPAGAPVLDGEGRVLAVVTETLGTHRVRAVPASVVKELLRELTPTTTDPSTVVTRGEEVRTGSR